MSTSKEYTLPVTEQSNAITRSIDSASNIDIINVLFQADQEIFNGWDGSSGLFDERFLKSMDELQNVAKHFLKKHSSERDSVIIMSGCGTSGRLGFMIANYFNSVCTNEGFHPSYDYLIAGGDKALFASQEAPEDNPHIGKEDLENASVGKAHVLYIGITCGLSAAYVAGQLEYCMDNRDKFTPVLVGFNPTYLAKTAKVENWDKTFAQVVSRLENSECGFILNPIIGPEPITGSTRMKSGSATKIILETLFLGIHGHKSGYKISPIELLKAYENVQKVTYSLSSDLSNIMNLTGESLRRDGHIYYIGKDRLGIVGMIDASECPPTYGASFDDVRGFLYRGYESLGNKSGPLVDCADISVCYFGQEIVPSIKETDTIIFLLRDGEIEVDTRVLCSSAKKVVINFQSSDNHKIPEEMAQHVDIVLEVMLRNVIEEPSHLYLKTGLPVLEEISCKWMCNVFSTSAHIRKGKVFENTMVDVRVSNNKLYYRALRILQKYSNTNADEAEMALLKSIYNTENLGGDIYQLPTSRHIEKATCMEKVVPVALVVANSNSSPQSTRDKLSSFPMIRDAIQRLVISGKQ